MQASLAHQACPAGLSRRTVLGCRLDTGAHFCGRGVPAVAAARAAAAPHVSPPTCLRLQRRLAQHTSQHHKPLVQQHGCSRMGVRAAAAAAQPLESGHSWQMRLLRLLPEPLRRNWPLLQRCTVTIAMLAIIRLGYYISMPGVDLQRLPEAVLGTTEGERLLRAVYGQASALPASLFDLGISAYINASIIISTLLMIPAEWFGQVQPEYLRQMREARKEGKAGEAKIQDNINYMAFAFALYFSCHRAFELSGYALYSKWFVAKTMAALMAGSSMIHHCANTITAHGIGNGTTLVICMGIITEYSETLHKVLSSLETAALGAWQLGLIGASYLALMLFTVYLSTTEVRLPVVQYSSTPMQPSSSGSSRQDLYIQARKLLDRKAAESGRQSAHFPILLNSSGVMPLIFAGALYYGGLPVAAAFFGSPELYSAVCTLQRSLTGLGIYGLLVLLLSALPFGGLNPTEVSEYFNQISVGIKGVAPGHDTVLHLRKKFSQCKFWGGVALALLAMIAHLFDSACTKLVGASLGASSLIIIVGAVLQTVRQVESLKEGPTLQTKLDQERGLIQSLNYLS